MEGWLFLTKLSTIVTSLTRVAGSTLGRTTNPTRGISTITEPCSDGNSIIPSGCRRLRYRKLKKFLRGSYIFYKKPLSDAMSRCTRMLKNYRKTFNRSIRKEIDELE